MYNTFAPPGAAWDEACRRIWQQVLKEHAAQLAKLGWWQRCKLLKQLEGEAAQRLAQLEARYGAEGDSRSRRPGLCAFVLW